MSPYLRSRLLPVQSNLFRYVTVATRLLAVATCMVLTGHAFEKMLAGLPGNVG